MSRNVCGLCNEYHPEDYLFEMHVKWCRRKHALEAQKRPADVRAPDEEDAPPREPPTRIKSGSAPHTRRKR